jgi:VanZ family protein
MGVHAEPAAVAAPWPYALARRALRLCVQRRHGLVLLALIGVLALSSIPHTQPPRMHGLDKLKHALEYFLVGLVFLNLATRGFVRLAPGRVLGAWLMLLALAVLDETYQRWVPGRSFDWRDVAASATGGLAAVAAVLAWWLGRRLGRRLRGRVAPATPTAADPRTP